MADWQDLPAVRAVVERFLETALKRYRVERNTAEALLRERLAASADFATLARRGDGPERLLRCRAYKQAAAEARQRIYYGLRRYRSDPGRHHDHLTRLEALPPAAPARERQAAALALARDHASTRERLADLETFYGQIFHLAGAPHSILDIGCGLHPLLFPFDGAGACVERYLAIDKDPQAVRAVAAYARARGDGRLGALAWEIGEGWQAVPPPPFELALLLKVVPIVARTAPGLLPILAAAPARRLLLTGSRLALTRRASIERRERALLGRFCRDQGLRRLGELEAGEEFGWLVERE